MFAVVVGLLVAVMLLVARLDVSVMMVPPPLDVNAAKVVAPPKMPVAYNETDWLSESVVVAEPAAIGVE